MNKVFLFIHFLAVSIFSFGQVPNDDIENREMLQIDKAHHSRTHGCTVQRHWVDEKLTGKCIEYHNDQRFFFNSGEYSRLFVDISKQECLDLRGVQLVVLEAVPCDISTYDVITRISLETQDDIYVPLDSLKKERDYLINVDGYQHDFCSFEIEVSPTGKELPLDESLEIDVNSMVLGKQIHVDWYVPDSLKHSITEFQVYKRVSPEFKSKLVKTVPIIADAYGALQIDYAFQDSIQAKKRYYYQLAALEADREIHLMDKFEIYISGEPTNTNYRNVIEIPLGKIPRKSSITVLVFDHKTMKMVFHKQFTHSEGKREVYNFFTRDLASKGITKLVIDVINDKIRERKRYTYELLLDYM